jgi:PAS domain S-box-containing protein
MEDKTRMKSNFLERLHSPQQMQQLFNHLPDIYFFAKDRTGRFMMGNDLFVRQCGVETEAEIIGKSDFDFFIVGRAESYVQDDQHVIQTGESIINRVELAPGSGNAINWFVTTKVPLYSTDGKIIGLAGTARDITRAELTLQPYIEMQTVLEFVRDHYADPLGVSELAALVHLSISQFERRFRTVFQITPLKHIMNVRIRAACVFLTTTSNTIASIALDCGFYDHPHFTRNFRKIMGMSPKEYRHQNSEERKPRIQVFS